MSAANAKKWGLFFVAVVIAIGAANTLRRHVPAVGGVVAKAMEGF